MDKQALFRLIPAVDRLMASPQLAHVFTAHPRSLVLRAVHDILAELRRGIGEGTLDDGVLLEFDRVCSRVVQRAEAMDRPSLVHAVNATGVVVHTNLGRSVLAERVLRRLVTVGGAYSNLEYRLDQGARGSRYSHVEGILKELTSADAAMVVNNNAAAVLISLETLARGREAVVSRGQLVEIGGAFRIPDVMRKSGAVMREVGTTNRTHLRDYEEAVTPETAVLLRVHRSNFQLVGFTRDVATEDLVALGRRHGIPVLEDLGSGCLVDFSRYGLVREPLVQDVLAAGVDLVTFSGDKLLGGPQAGIILGNRDLVERIRSNPLNRAVRIDKLTLAALEETLRLYRDEEAAVRLIPTLGMIFMPYKALRSRASGLRRRIGRLDSPNFSVGFKDGASKTGGGALPLLDLPTRLIRLVPGKMSAKSMEERLRTYDPPIISRVENGEVLLDVRTILDRELGTVARAVRELASAGA
jgi:L-seryl-tRNA(Ser) seleniumtransferase